MPDTALPSTDLDRQVEELVDDDYYYQQRPDVAASGLDPEAHFLHYGWREGVNPNALFDIEYYLSQRPDVAQTNVNPLLHFLTNGATEGINPSEWFDVTYYLQERPDVDDAGTNPLLHYLTDGAREHTSPNPLFDYNYYLTERPDVAAADMDAFTHFVNFGMHERVDPSPFFDMSAYLAANPDVAAAGVNPFEHFLGSGIRESRSLGNGLDLDLFANDSLFQADLANGDIADALERIREVAPFVPDFQMPSLPGWHFDANDLQSPPDSFTLPTSGEYADLEFDIPSGYDLPDDVFINGFDFFQAHFDPALIDAMVANLDNSSMDDFFAHLDTNDLSFLDTQTTFDFASAFAELSPSEQGWAAAAMDPDTFSHLAGMGIDLSEQDAHGGYGGYGGDGGSLLDDLGDILDDLFGGSPFGGQEEGQDGRGDDHGGHSLLPPLTVMGMVTEPEPSWIGW